MRRPICIAWLAATGTLSSPAGIFEDRVQPILSANCQPCHDASSRTSGFSIASEQSVIAGGARHGAAVIAGKPAESPLIKVLNGEIKPQMPMGKTLSAEHIAAIASWILELKPEQTAAKQQRYWAFVKPVKHTVPSIDGARSEIDAFVMK